MKTSHSGFIFGQIVTNKIPLTDEYGGVIEPGRKLRIVAIAAKVFYTKKELVNQFPDRYDKKPYFLNLVRAEQKEDYGNRFRVHFVTVKA